MPSVRQWAQARIGVAVASLGLVSSSVGTHRASNIDSKASLDRFSAINLATASGRESWEMSQPCNMVLELVMIYQIVTHPQIVSDEDLRDGGPKQAAAPVHRAHEVTANCNSNARTGHCRWRHNGRWGQLFALRANPQHERHSTGHRVAYG